MRKKKRHCELFCYKKKKEQAKGKVFFTNMAISCHHMEQKNMDDACAFPLFPCNNLVVVTRQKRKALHQRKKELVEHIIAIKKSFASMKSQSFIKREAHLTKVYLKSKEGSTIHVLPSCFFSLTIKRKEEISRCKKIFDNPKNNSLLI